MTNEPQFAATKLADLARLPPAAPMQPVESISGLDDAAIAALLNASEIEQDSPEDAAYGT